MPNFQKEDYVKEKKPLPLTMNSERERGIRA